MAFSDSINSICLPEVSYSSPESFIDKGVITQGWSRDYEGRVNNQLTEILVTIRLGRYPSLNITIIIFIFYRDPEECNAFIASFSSSLTLTSSQYCAGSNREDVQTARGDSGGPSILRGYNDGVQYTLIGKDSE